MCRKAIALCALCVWGCDEATLPQPAAPAQPVVYAISVDQHEHVVMHDHHDDDEDAARYRAVAPDRAGRVLILSTSHLERPSEVVGVVDVHEEMGKHEEALDLLRRKAAALGADAVIGVEFHHGEGHSEPTHLSGLAVRFLESRP